MSTHTKGPWRFHDEMIKAGGDGRKGTTICEAPGGFHWECEPENLANAMLISAAPDLLKACEAGLRLLNMHSDFREGAETENGQAMLRAAIAKATHGKG